ncbi:MAG: hypothetical protein HOP09_14795 [Hyphomicrobium sp.]|nr:hypothetical protein [Hyphomicrobium sp.]
MKWVDDRHRLLSTIAIYAAHDPNSAESMIGTARSGWYSTPWERIVVGDIVRGATLSLSYSPDPFTLGRVVETWSDGRDPSLLLREIGGKGTCRVSNETWSVLRGVPGELLFEGWQWRWREIARKAVDRLTIDHWLPRWGGITFGGDPSAMSAVLTIRPAFGRGASVSCGLNFTRRTTQKQLVEALLPEVKRLKELQTSKEG